MRIAMISEHASPLAAIGGEDAGGQNLHVADLASALARLGHEVTVHTRRDDPTLPDRVRCAAGFDVAHVTAGPATVLAKDDLLPFMRTFGRTLARQWAAPDQRPDIIHAHFWMSGVAAREAATHAQLPIVLTYHALGSVKRRHQHGEDTSPAGRIPAERRLGRSVDRVVAQCTDEVAELVRLGVPPDNMVVVPSGVDLSLFSPHGTAAPRVPGLRRVVTVGRLVPRKGYDDLIRAVATIPATELVVVGGPPGDVSADPEYRRLTELARRLGTGDRVRLVGGQQRASVAAWYRSADVVACAPWYEPFGLTPLEAMACGVPVVAYAVGGLRDSVVDAVTGRQVEPRSVSGLIDALREVLDDEDHRRRLGEAALARARARYSWDSTAERIADVYTDVLVRRSRMEKVA